MPTSTVPAASATLTEATTPPAARAGEGRGKEATSAASPSQAGEAAGSALPASIGCVAAAIASKVEPLRCRLPPMAYSQTHARCGAVRVVSNTAVPFELRARLRSRQRPSRGWTLGAT